jgi:CheY-like chemotaxis protein
MEKLACVLLVDDDDTANYVNQTLLEDLEVAQKILVARNGAEALKVMERQCAQGDCPQLILLDINMPVMNGFEYLEAYKALDFQLKQSVVIVMLTTSLNPVDVGRIGQVTAVGYPNKPLTEDMVRHLLKQHFDPGLSG